MNLFLFGFTKTKTGAKTAPRAQKLSYLDGWAPQLSARVNDGTPAAGVIGHIVLQTADPKHFGFYILIQIKTDTRLKSNHTLLSHILYDMNLLRFLFLRLSGLRPLLTHANKSLYEREQSDLID